MQIVVVSDTHGRNEVFQELRFRHPQASAFLHCGDSETDEVNLDGFVSVQGNNDYYTNYPMEITLELEGVRVFMTHGQYLRHHNRIESLVAKAKENECRLVLYGHTHVFNVQEEDGVVLVNPGSLNHQRDGSSPSYALITLNKGKIKVERIDYPRFKKK
jgi:putative phosphoesterase